MSAAATSAGPSTAVVRDRAPVTPARALLVLVGDGMRRRARTSAAWGLALGLMTASMLAIWPSIDGQIDQALEHYPKALKEAFGLTSLTTAEQYVDVEMLSIIVPFAIALLAIRCVVTDLVGAEEHGALDVTLSLPVPRWVVAAVAAIVAAVVAGIALVVGWVLACAGSLAFGAGADAAVLGRGFLAVWPLALVATGLASVASGVLRSPGAATGVAAGVLVAMYVADLVGRVAPDLDALRVVSAFRYYGSAIQDGVAVTDVVVLSTAAALLTAVGALLLERRDVG